MRRALHPALTLAICMSALAAIPPKWDMLSLEELAGNADGFSATWRRENQLVYPVETSLLQSSFSRTGAILSGPKMIRPVVDRAPAQVRRGSSEKLPALEPPTRRIVIARPWADGVFIVRDTYRELYAVWTDENGRVAYNSLIMSAEPGRLAPEAVAVDDDGVNVLVAWLERKPKSSTTSVHAAFVKRDGTVDRIREPLVTTELGVDAIALAWNGQKHLLAGMYALYPESPKRGRVFAMRFDEALKAVDPRPRDVPGASASRGVFAAASKDTFAIAWDYGSPRVAIVDAKGKISQPIDLHPERLRAPPKTR